MRKFLWVIPIILLIGGLACWIYEDESEKPLDEIKLYGNIDLRQVDLAFLLSERIDQVLVDEGDVVKEGQKLACLETIRLQQAVDEAKANAMAMEQNYLRIKHGPRPEEIDQAKSNVNAAEATLSNAQIRSKRMLALVTSNSVSKQEADDAQANERVAAANLDVARKQLELLEIGSRIEDINQALSQYHQAVATLNIQEQQLKDAILYAPSDAVVRNRDLHHICW